MALPCVLAFDLGSSTFRAALYDFNGAVLASAAVKDAIAPPVHDRSEHDPESWFRSLRTLVEQLFAAPNSAAFSIKGIAISAITRTQIFVDDDGRAVRPAITWRDTRAVAEGAEIKDAIARLGLDDTVLGHAPIGSFHPVARMLWVAKHEPDRLARTRWVLFPTNYLAFRLTGRASWDRIQASLALDYRGFGIPGDLFARLNIPERVIPPLLWPEDAVGTVSPGLPAPLDRLAGVPVFASSLDGWCNTLGIGAIRDGGFYIVSGTSDIIGLVHRSPVQVEGLATVPWTQDLFHMGGVIQSGGDCLTWFADALADFLPERLPLDKLVEKLLAVPRERHAPIFLPYLTGERVPIWQPHVRAGFLGIDREHGFADLLWSVLEGVAFANRHGLELAAERAGVPIGEVRITGGAARLDAWCQLRADILNCDVVRTAESESGLFGAALIALRGLGRFPSWDGAQDTLVRIDRRFTPRPKQAAFYERAYRAYRDFSALSIDPSRRLFEAMEGADVEPADTPQTRKAMVP